MSSENGFQSVIRLFLGIPTTNRRSWVVSQEAFSLFQHRICSKSYWNRYNSHYDFKTTLQVDSAQGRDSLVFRYFSLHEVLPSTLSGRVVSQSPRRRVPFLKQLSRGHRVGDVKASPLNQVSPQTR